MRVVVAAVGAPPHPLPRLFPGPASLPPDEAAQLVLDGAARARELLQARAADGRAQLAKAQLAKAAAGAALGPQALALVAAALAERPALVREIPLDAEHVRMYAKGCWSALVAIVGAADGAHEADRIVRCAIAHPMGVAEHNSLARLLIDRAAAVSAETLFVYLDAIEASCRAQPAGDARVHNVRLAAKVFNSALDANAALAEAMAIELSSFCLSYAAVKDAADLYRRIVH
ncbi:hypothetical protein H4R18_000507 [Coemansia javaensis]|uniref:Uncharacterized protein n=1 Tax=Coemansia javaensis TaxID=2761396 RepID=A0A9W8LKG3_9FUNG|nr:hypothetical protein H4R18_000507 [Coemansia javaensis]